MHRNHLQVLEGGRKEGRQETLRHLYATYGGTVFGRCRYLLKNPDAAEDAMQEVFAKALGEYGTFRQEASPLTWLLTLATHHCLNLLRSQNAPWKLRFLRDEESKPQAHGGPQLMETRDLVRQWLGRCDPETQAVAIHYHVDGMTLEEVARAVGRSVPTIRKRLEHFAKESGLTP